jgi:two-component system sensor kinase FixL
MAGTITCLPSISPFASIYPGSREAISHNSTPRRQTIEMDERVFADARFFRLITQASPAGMVITDADGMIVLINSKAEEIFGYSHDELIGQPVEGLIPRAHRGVHLSHRACYMAHPEPRSMAAGYDLFGQRKDGSQVAVDISLHPFPTDDGVFVLANVLDATDRRRAARQREAQQSVERLTMMGQLAGSVAHEIRTPLCVIRNNIYYLRILAERMGTDGTECLDEIDEAIGKADRIVNELLDFTRVSSSRVGKIPLQDTIDQSLVDLATTGGVELELPEVHKDWLIEVDQEQIQRVLANLVTNAVDAMGSGGRLEIRVGRDTKNVWIEVADNGPGISSSEKERIFDPLYTTKPTGVGLGLALSRRYAEGNGGTLLVTDSDAGGACFRLTLPRPGKQDDEPN